MTVNNDHADDQPLRPIRRLQIYRPESMTASLTCDIVQGQTVERTKHYFMQQYPVDVRLFLLAFAALLRSRCLLNSLPRDFCAFHQCSRSVDHLVHLCTRDSLQNDVYDFEIPSIHVKAKLTDVLLLVICA
jgi:hypothetical protein